MFLNQDVHLYHTTIQIQKYQPFYCTSNKTLHPPCCFIIIFNRYDACCHGNMEQFINRVLCITQSRLCYQKICYIASIINKTRDKNPCLSTKIF